MYLWGVKPARKEICKLPTACTEIKNYRVFDLIQRFCYGFEDKILSTGFPISISKYLAHR